jgi:molybdopterin molybdotransferase
VGRGGAASRDPGRLGGRHRGRSRRRASAGGSAGRHRRGVGDYDVVKQALASLGIALAIERIAIRPGRPTWFGRVRERPVLGLPGNPAAALVCARVFLRPLLAAMLGREAGEDAAGALLDGEVAASGANECYLRAVAAPRADLRLSVRPCTNQDTSLLSVFAAANALIRRPAGAPPAMSGETVELLLL